MHPCKLSGWSGDAVPSSPALYAIYRPLPWRQGVTGEALEDPIGPHVSVSIFHHDQYSVIPHSRYWEARVAMDKVGFLL